MGIVYACTHSETGTEAAIKTVFEPEAYRFGQIRREIRALARLHHPGVVQILDQGVSNGSPWYAMERLQGTTLKDVFLELWKIRSESRQPVLGPNSMVFASSPDETVFLPQGQEAAVAQPLLSPSMEAETYLWNEAESLRKGLSLLQRVCETLSFLHGEGIIHRDLKPANIFIRDTGEPVLVDFGLAEVAQGATGREKIEFLEQISGSPSYMSPEQIRGESLDARSDLYSMGCVLYEFLTGRPPFAGHRSQAIHGHLERQPQPPSSLMGGIPPELDALTVSLLTKNRADRPGYAETVAEALAALETDPPQWSTPVPDAKPYFYRAPFVGRQSALSVFSDLLGRASEGRGALVLVSGESGAGKTRLALQTGIQARRIGVAVTTGECKPLGEEGVSAQGYGAPLHPFRSLVEAMADRCLEEGPVCQSHVFGDRTAVLAVYFPVLRTLPGASDLANPPPLTGAAARHRLFSALEESLSAHLEGRSLFLILDDLQWADELSLGFLKHLLSGRLNALPLLLFGTFRSEERTAPLDALFTDTATTGVTLNRMTPAEVGDMTRGILAMHHPPEGFVTFLTERSNGNPFFIAEYLRGAVSEQVLIRDRQGRWLLPVDGTSATEGYASLPLPSSLRQLIELRLSKLRPFERHVVDAAATMGNTLDIRVLSLAIDLSDSDLVAITDELVSRQIIEPADGERYRFVHDKIGEIAEAALSQETRQTLNQQLAVAYETAYPDGKDLEARRAALGWHWSQAGEPERAIPNLKAAAHNAQEVHSLSEAIALLKSALREVTTIRDRESAAADVWRQEAVDLAEQYGDALSLQKRYGEARTAFEQAAHDAPDAPVLLARLGRKTGKTWEIEHRHDDALAAYGTAESRLDMSKALSRDAQDEWLQIILNRVWIYYWQNHAQDMDSELEKIRPFIEQAGTPNHRYQYYMSLINRNHRLLRYRMVPETREFARLMLEAALDSGAPTEIAYAHYMVGFILTFTDDLDEAEARLFESMQAFRRFGDLAEETRSMAYLAVVYRRQGKVEETIRTAQMLHDLTEARKMPEYQGLADALLGWAAWRTGDTDEAFRLCQGAMDRWQDFTVANTYTYPFQWTAGLVLIALLLQEHSKERGDGLSIAALLGNSPQMHLPDSLYDALGRAGAASDPTTAQACLQTAVDHAKAHRYL